jgi:hypothetical protein
MNYTNYNPNYRPYNPKAAVKNFTDLEVYQKALEGSVFVASEVISFWEASKSMKALKHKNKKAQKAQIMDNQGFNSQEIASTIIKSMSITALSIPHLIAESHSKRFGASAEHLKILDEVMLKCNKMVVYLEQTRDICGTGIETARFAEEINKYFYIRRKVLNLQRVWKKYLAENIKT